MLKDEILFSFTGYLTKELLSAVYHLIEKGILASGLTPIKKKLFYQVFLECAQNMYHHQEIIQTENMIYFSVPYFNPFFIIEKEEKGHYIIKSGNYIRSENAAVLKERIDTINNMSSIELRKFYLKKLITQDCTLNGGAGLGLIEIAKKSSNPIEYQFFPVSTSHSFFTLTALINYI